MLASEEFGLLLVKLLDHVILGICSFPFIHCHSYLVKVGPLLLLLDAVPVVWILAQSSNSFPKNCQSWSPTNSACEFPTTSTTLRKRFKNPFLRHCNGIAHGSCHAFFFPCSFLFPLAEGIQKDEEKASPANGEDEDRMIRGRGQLSSFNQGQTLISAKASHGGYP